MQFEYIRYMQKPESTDGFKEMIVDLFHSIFGEIDIPELEGLREFAVEYKEKGKRWCMPGDYADLSKWKRSNKFSEQNITGSLVKRTFNHISLPGEISVSVIKPHAMMGGDRRYIIDLDNEFHCSIYDVLRRLDDQGIVYIEALYEETEKEPVKTTSMLDTPKPEGFGAFS